MSEGPPYEVSYAEPALAFLEGQPKKFQQQVVDKIDRLAMDFRPPGCKLVHGMQDGGEPVYRIRQGDYRVLYVVREPTVKPAVVILDIDHRKDVYR